LIRKWPWRCKSAASPRCRGQPTNGIHRWSRCPCASCRGGRYAVVRSDSRLCATLLVGQKTVSRLDLSRTVRHPAQRIPLALGRPQIPAQLSASVRPGEVLPRLNAGRFGFPGGGAAQHLQNQIRPRQSSARFSSVPVGACAEQKPRRSGAVFISAYFAGAFLRRAFL
jgi:hypothetical protein